MPRGFPKGKSKFAPLTEAVANGTYSPTVRTPPEPSKKTDSDLIELFNLCIDREKLKRLLTEADLDRLAIILRDDGAHFVHTTVHFRLGV